jgi:hypothetical protein
MNTTTLNRRSLRLAGAAVVAALALTLAGCSKGGDVADVDAGVTPTEPTVTIGDAVVGENVDGTLDTVTYATEIGFDAGVVTVGDLALALEGFEKRPSDEGVFNPWPALVGLETYRVVEGADPVNVSVAILNKTSLVNAEAGPMIDFGFRVAGLGDAEAGERITRTGNDRTCPAETRTGAVGGEDGGPVLTEGIVLAGGGDGTPVAVVVRGSDAAAVSATVDGVLAGICGKG